MQFLEQVDELRRAAFGNALRPPTVPDISEEPIERVGCIKCDNWRLNTAGFREGFRD
jgi:hypothetical protein